MKHKKNKQKMQIELLTLVAGKFKAMSDPIRLSILQSLMDGEKSVGQIQREVGSSQPNVSKHLTLLDLAGFIGRRKEGVTVHYRIIDETVFDLCDLVCRKLQGNLNTTANRINNLMKNKKRA